jgi:hypothetical protein
MQILCLCSCCITTWALGESQALSNGIAPTDFVIGISPFLDKSVKDEVYRNVVRLIAEDLPLNSTLGVYDAFHQRTITQLNLPDVKVFNSPNARANQFAGAIRDLKVFLAHDHTKPNQNEERFVGVIRLPQFLDFLSERTTLGTNSSAVLLIGSPLYQDAKEPAFSMLKGYFPSDGHLQATRERSIFGFVQQAGPSKHTGIHWLYFGDPWVSDLHQERVQRFWTLYLERRGAELAAFSADPSTALDSFRRLRSGSGAATKHWNVDKEQTKIEMLRVGRNVEVADWLTSDEVASPAQVPPAIRVGPMRIGIRWKEAIDLDLYATARPGAETLFFQHNRSPEGYYYRDHRASPGKEYEFIEFESPVDVSVVQAFINFYKGQAAEGARGEVRIEFDGRIYSGPFAIPTDRGNLGRAGAEQQRFWTPIPILELLKIVRPRPRDG